MSEEEKSTEGLKLGDIRKLIEEIIDGKKDDTKTAGDKPAEDGNISSKVRQAIEDIKAREKDDKEKEDLKTQVAALTEATKEKPPVERRRVHKLMGWGENAD